MKIFSEGIEINSYEIPSNIESDFEIQKNAIYSYFILDGEVTLNKETAEKGDFIIVSEVNNINITAKSKTKVFEIKSPLRPSYSTYSERFMK